MRTNRLCIGNLGHLVTVHKLQEFFSNYGEVKRVSIVEGRNYGFIQMSNRAGAKRAKTALDGSGLEGLTLKVDRAYPRRKRKKVYRRQCSGLMQAEGSSVGKGPDDLPWEEAPSGSVVLSQAAVIRPVWGGVSYSVTGRVFHEEEGKPVRVPDYSAYIFCDAALCAPLQRL